MRLKYDQEHILEAPMPYPEGHREQVRDKIIDSARRLFNKNGFEGVSVDAIMAHAGLTRGGFYSYFSSKSELYGEVMRCFFTDPDWPHRWEGVHFDHRSDAGPQVVRAYLSKGHFDDVENSCPLIALPNDVARADETVKAAFETVFRAMIALIGRDIKSKRAREKAAMAIAALCIGGMVVSRSVNSPELGEQLRKAAMKAALELGGWAA
jgi:AcrR family transcriptional regulator